MNVEKYEDLPFIFRNSFSLIIVYFFLSLLLETSVPFSVFCPFIFGKFCGGPAMKE